MLNLLTRATNNTVLALKQSAKAKELVNTIALTKNWSEDRNLVSSMVCLMYRNQLLRQNLLPYVDGFKRTSKGKLKNSEGPAFGDSAQAIRDALRDILVFKGYLTSQGALLVVQNPRQLLWDELLVGLQKYSFREQILHLCLKLIPEEDTADHTSEILRCCARGSFFGWIFKDIQEKRDL